MVYNFLGLRVRGEIRESLAVTKKSEFSERNTGHISKKIIGQILFTFLAIAIFAALPGKAVGSDTAELDYDRGVVELSGGDFAEAEQQFKSALAKRPEHGRTY